MSSQELQSGLNFFVALIVSLTVHEVAHGWVALRLGDPTAKNEGRLTLDPRQHLDVLGTLMLLVMAFNHFGFGWAKPVPVNPLFFKKPRRGFGIVAAAGPLSNILMALIAFWTFVALGDFANKREFFVDFLRIFVWVNLGLAAFNLIPLYPLDGQKVVSAVLPSAMARKYDVFSLRMGAWPLLILVIWEWVLPFQGPLGWMIQTILPLFESLLLLSVSWIR